ncbi:HNH endonuclease, partial [Bradyrhizobium sp. P5_C11_2]
TKVCPTCSRSFARVDRNPMSPENWRRRVYCSRSCAAVGRQAARAPVLDEVFEEYLADNPETGCLDWTGTHTAAGYGQIRIGGRRVYAHRYAFARAHGRIPRGLFVLHRCDRPSCVHEGHLFLGTALTNAQDCVSKGRNSRGSAHPGAKLTEAIVLKGREAGISPAEFARQTGVSRGVAAKALGGATWRHVGMPGPATGITCAAV